jgi:hypothetical protein
MKKYFSLLAVAALISILFASSCTHGTVNEPHNDTAFLKGTWASANNAAFTFTINTDLTFECVLKKIDTLPSSVNAKIKGRLDAAASGLGPNDYYLRNLATVENDKYPDNEIIKDVVESTMNNILVTLTPKGNYTRFTFTSPTQLAQNFFGFDGDFVKRP